MNNNRRAIPLSPIQPKVLRRLIQMFGKLLLNLAFLDAPYPIPVFDGFEKMIIVLNPPHGFDLIRQLPYLHNSR